MASVRRQTVPTEHLLVADGHPQDWLESESVRHLRLDRSHGDFGNTPQEIIKAYGLLNANISHTAGPWTVTLWGRNLTDKYYYEAVAITGAFQQFPGVPRTYGLTAFVNFQ